MYYARVASHLGIDPGILMKEKDWRVNAAREAAALIIISDKTANTDK